ncbi:hypothetical protein BLM15_11915 [Bosea sp. Tri-49]|nr:hypothetical protein BLM15_11915 [Bosea sp. Tri-49]
MGADGAKPVGRAAGSGAKGWAASGWRGGANGVVGGSWIAAPAGRGCAKPIGLCPTTVGGSKL